MRIIAGNLKNRVLKSPRGKKTRPTTGLLREAVFSILQNEIEGAVFLDLFAGTGAMGFEALSRGAKKAYFVESDRDAFFCLKENSLELDLKEQVSLIKASAFKAMDQFSKEALSFDIIYIDPPYGEEVWHSGEKKPLALRVVESLFELSLLKENGFLFLEEGEKTFLDEAALADLPLVQKRKYGKSVLYIFRKTSVSP